MNICIHVHVHTCMLYSIPASPDICTVDHDNFIKSMCPFAFVYMCIHCTQHVSVCV